MPNLTLSFFGPGQILSADGTEIVLRGRKEFALLVYLVSEPDHAHRREFLGGLLWPEMADNEFRNNLRVTLSRLKNRLAQRRVDPLLIERQTIQFRPDFDFIVDTREFQQHITAIKNHPHRELENCHSCLQMIEHALSLYKGQFLQGFHVDDSYSFEEWVTYQREYYQRTVIELLGMAEAAYLANGNTAEAIKTVRRHLALDPLGEDAHRLMMRLLVQNGERHAALVQYETCRRLLYQELDVQPESATIKLYQQIRDSESLTVESGASRTTSSDTDKRTPLFPLLDSGESAPADEPSPTHPSAANEMVDTLARQWGMDFGQKLFGVDAYKAELVAILESHERPWLVAIDGIGGIGKTSIAQALSRVLLGNERFASVAWVSAKQDEFHADAGITPTAQPALTADETVTELLIQLTGPAGLAGSADTRSRQLIQALQETPALLVIDNLETVADSQELVPLLVQLSNPAKVLITSRLSLQRYPEVYAKTIGELTFDDALALLRHEAATRNIALLQTATDDHLRAIYDVVGGHPLALNLVLGQLTYLPLRQVLTSLQEARGERIEQLYSYIYWQAWQMLDDASRQLFLTLPIVFNGTFDQLLETSLLEPEELQGALTQLIGLSLVQVGGHILEPRYRLHRLTETFLMTEVLKWQSR